MKIQCDVCSTGAASVFCAADEAALCPSCDHRVHHANKLASKHQRLPLLHPKESPLCDICQEKRGFLFCQQDRAILCRDCDIPIHNNQHTKKHSRFLLTGIKLISPAPTDDDDDDPCSSKLLPPASTPLPIPNSSSDATKFKSTEKLQVNDSSTDISDYLMEMLPGWHVEDLFHPFGFHDDHQKEDGMLAAFSSSRESDFGGGRWCMNGFSCDDERKMEGFWVPQSGSADLYFPEGSGVLKDDEVGMMSSKRSRRSDDDLFAVPQLSLPSNRSRPLW